MRLANCFYLQSDDSGRLGVRNNNIDLIVRKIQQNFLVLLTAVLLLGLSGINHSSFAASITTVAGNALAGNNEGSRASSQLSSPYSLVKDSSGQIYSLNTGVISRINNDGSISIVAGDGTNGFLNGFGRATKLNLPKYAAFDAVGNLIIADTANNRIRKFNLSTGELSTLAGTGVAGFADGPASTAIFRNPSGIAIDSNGTIYVADATNARIRRISADLSTVSTVIGSTSGFVDGIGAAARISNNLEAIVLLNGNQLLIADTGNRRIRRVSNLKGVPVVSTIAGDGTSGNSDGAALLSKFSSPRSLVLDANASVLYISDSGNHNLRKLDLISNQVSTIAGLGSAGYADGNETVARFNQPSGLLIKSGKIYLADTLNHSIREIDLLNSFSPQALRTVAGRNIGGLVDGVLGVNSLNAPRGTAYNSNGDLFIADASSHRIRKLSKNGQLITFAGSSAGYLDGLAGAARFNAPSDLAFDSLGNLYVADTGNHCIRKIDLLANVTTYAGLNAAGFVDALGTLARFSSPRGIALDSLGNLYVADFGNNRIRKIATDASVSTVIGSASGFIDGGAAVARFASPADLVLASDTKIYVADSGNHVIRQLDFNGIGWLATTLNSTTGAGFNDGALTGALFSAPYGLALDSMQNIYVADRANNRIRKIDLAVKQVSTVAGSGLAGFLDAAVLDAAINAPEAITFNANGQLLISDTVNNRIRLAAISSPATAPGEDPGEDRFVVSTVAGHLGQAGFRDGIGSSALFSSPYGMAFDSLANLYVADRANNRIRKITENGIVSTFAGSGTAGSLDGLGVLAQFSAPSDIVADSQGNFFVVDTSNHVIRKITNAGQVSVFAGGTGLQGDIDGTSTAARFRSPAAIAIDSSDNLYLADSGNNKIKKITASAAVTTIAGGAAAYADGSLVNSRFRSPSGIFVNSNNEILVADTGNNRIRKIANNSVTTVAGAGTATFADGPALQALFNSPTDLIQDQNGNIFVADNLNNRIRKISSQGLVTTYSGTGLAGYGDGYIEDAVFNRPRAIAFDANKNLIILEDGNRIRKITKEIKPDPVIIEVPVEVPVPVVVNPLNKAPILALVNDIQFSGSNSFTIRKGTPLILKAFAFDYEDGKNIEKTISWTSSSQGLLASGKTSFDASLLEIGTHDISIKVQDASGLAAIVSFTIVVIDPNQDLGDGQGGGADRNGDGVIDDDDKIITPQELVDTVVKIISPKKTVKSRTSKLRAYALDLSDSNSVDISNQIIWEKATADLREFLVQGSTLKLSMLEPGVHAVYARIGEVETSMQVTVKAKKILIENPDSVIP